jgi:hypothetical protein
MGEKTGQTVDLGPEDSAVVLRADGGVEVLFPKQDMNLDSEEQVLPQTLIAASLGAAVKNERLLHNIVSDFTRRARDLNKNRTRGSDLSQSPM